MKKSKLNRDWHRGHRMPVKATMEQRLEWHLEHAKYCRCRPTPVKIAEEMAKRGTSTHNENLTGMIYDAIEKYLLSQKGAAKDFPFGSDVAVFKVAGKMFALVAWSDAPLRITLKCDPDEADFFRTMYEAVKPGYYMNKAHWNTITLNGSVPDELLLKMINSSYALVVKGLQKSER